MRCHTRGLGLLSPGAPQLGERPDCLFLWQPGSKTQARDDPALLPKAIQLQRCTETALFDLNIKFYSFFFFFHFFPGGKSSFKWTFILSHIPGGAFILKGIHPVWAARLIYIHYPTLPSWSSLPLGAASPGPDGHSARRQGPPCWIFFFFFFCCTIH